MKELIGRYTSRKFLLTAVGAVALYTIGQYGEMVVLLLGFLSVEGGADIVSKYKSGTLTASAVQEFVSQNDDEAIDRSTIVSGKSTSTPLFDESPKE